MYLVDSASHAIVGAVEFPGVLDYSMFMEEDGVIHIIAGSDDGTIAVWDIPYKPSEEMQPSQEFEPHFMDSVADSLDERGVDLLAFSDDSNYIAEFHEATGELGLHYKLRYTNELISKKADRSVSHVYSMAFSDDNNQLATTSTDGKLFVWNAFNGRFMYEHDIYAQSRVPVHFVQGTYNLLVASAEDTVVVLDPDDQAGKFTGGTKDRFADYVTYTIEATDGDVIKRADGRPSASINVTGMNSGDYILRVVAEAGPYKFSYQVPFMIKYTDETVTP